MGFFRRKDKDILDLTKRYKRQQEKIAQIQSDSQGESTDASTSGLAFLGDLAGAAQTSSQSDGYIDVSEGIGEKRRKLAKRLMDMTEKMEDLSNQIYHLQQRIEVLERKLDVNRF